MENVQFSEQTIKAATAAVVKTANNIIEAINNIGFETIKAVADLQTKGYETGEKIADEYALVLRRLSASPASIRSEVERVVQVAITELLRKQYETEAQIIASNAPEYETPATAKAERTKPVTAKKKGK